MRSGPRPRVVRAENPSPMTLDGTRTYIVGHTRPAVIDPGPADPGHIGRIVDELGGATPVAILLTHAHPDHAAGAGELARRTGARVVIGAGALTPPRIERLRSGPLRHGEEFGTDAGVLSAVATPGHAPEHFAFFWTGDEAPPGGAAFVGDLLMGEGDTTLIAPPEGNVAAFFRSLDRLESLGASELYPAHGAVIEDPAETIARYRRHRHDRLDQLREMLRRRPSATAYDLVDAIYGSELHPALRDAAAGSVTAMLDYLERSEDTDR